MFGEQSHLSPREARKLLLLAESELNRVQLCEEWQTMAHGVCDLAHRAQSIAGWASSAAVLVAGLMAWRDGSPARVAPKSSWFQKMLSGARLALTVWLALRPRGEKEQHSRCDN
jgi:hypothetical protein